LQVLFKLLWTPRPNQLDDIPSKTSGCFEQTPYEPGPGRPNEGPPGFGGAVCRRRETLCWSQDLGATEQKRKVKRQLVPMRAAGMGFPPNRRPYGGKLGRPYERLKDQTSGPKTPCP